MMKHKLTKKNQTPKIWLTELIQSSKTQKLKSLYQMTNTDFSANKIPHIKALCDFIFPVSHAKTNPF